MLKVEATAALVLAFEIAVSALIVLGLRRASKNAAEQNGEDRDYPEHGDDATSDGHNPADSSDVAVSLLKRFIAEIQANNGRHEAEERRFWDRQIGVAVWLNWLTGSAAIVGITGLILVYLALGETRRSTTEANRAWIAIIQVYSGESKTPGILMLQIEFQNIGRGAATNINFPRPVSDFVDYNLAQGGKAKSDDINHCKGITSFMGGEISYPPPARSVTQIFGIPISPYVGTNLAGVLNGHRAMRVMGCVAYDTFEETRFTWYCYFARREPDATIKYGICQTGNGTT